jgi:phosphohistidine phosphatase
MKTLFLVRHAKAHPPQQGLPDHERVLNERGRRDAPEMGRRLAQRGVRPELVITSTAARARATAQLLAAELGVAADAVREDARLYASAAGKLLYIIQEQEDDRNCLMLVGHNPEMSELAQHFSRELPEMPTAAVARIDFDVASWALVGSSTPASANLDFPKKGQERDSED